MLSLLLGALQLVAIPVGLEDARRVGQLFLKHHSNLTLTEDQLSLVYQSEGYLETSPANPIIYFYVFNLNPQGFILISGDDVVQPILGYSLEGTFTTGNMAPSVEKWLGSYRDQIRDMIQSHAEASPEIQQAWMRYQHSTSESTPSLNRNVSPLLQTQWNQSPHYNALCPGGSVTGCVATAMAQIMKYWNYPAMGSGFHSYNHDSYGTISANFGNTTYDWGSMPNVVNSPNIAVATLNFHCGVSVDMQYSPQVSGAFVIENSPTPQACSEYAFKTYFGYKPTLQGVERANYSESQWINLIKSELDASRPILYAGFGSGGGHAFVCDGYDNSGFFHFNWGWAGAYDGFYSINALNPSGTGTGGGTGGYNSGHQAVIGIEPPDGQGGGGGGGNSQSYDLGLYNYVTPSANTIYYGGSFSITTNIVNNGNTTFNGDYCAAVFDVQSNFIDYVSILSNYSLQSGYTYNNNLVFSSNGLFSMLPGTYYIGIFYRPSGGNWMAVGDNAGYVNIAQIEVINPNDIELNSTIQVSGGTTVVQGQPISVTLNIANAGWNTFYGQYGVGLYNLDGTFVELINTYTESQGLPSGYTYLAPYLTFASSAIQAPAGTYLLAVQHNPNNQGWQLTGSSYYQNPIYITVQAPSLSPDSYETNNAPNNAYTFPVNFTGNSANIFTTGSNLHNGSDIDFYKINLLPGFNYVVTARIHDSYNSGNGNSYSVDGLVSYSTNGSDWSNSYDDIITTNINITNGGTVYFLVAPYFQGNAGTYLLEINIARNAASVDVATIDTYSPIELYPQPAQDYAVLNLSENAGLIRSIILWNMQGETMPIESTPLSSHSYRLSLESVANGFYLVHVQTEKGLLTKKLIVHK